MGTKTSLALVKTLILAVALSMISFLASANPQLRIVGGQDVDISSAPSTVALLDTTTLAASGSFRLSQFCGGTVIADRWVLTAAHCVIDVNGDVIGPSAVAILAGTTDLAVTLNRPVGVIQIIVHENYTNLETGDDIALLGLAEKVTVPAAQLDYLPVVFNDLAVIVGWGALQSSVPQTFPTRLQGATVRMIPGAMCGELYSDYAGYVDDRQLCAGVTGGGIDTCQGDSGGPIYRLADDMLLTLTGITSWGIGCALESAPGVYTSIRSFRDWISQSTAANPLPAVVPGVTPPVVGAPITPTTFVPAATPAALSRFPGFVYITDSSATIDNGGGAGFLIIPLLMLSLVVRVVVRTGRARRVENSDR